MLRFMFLLGGAPLNVMSPSFRIMLHGHPHDSVDAHRTCIHMTQ